MQPITVFRFDRASGDWVEAPPASVDTGRRPTLRLATFNVLADCFPFLIRLAIDSPGRYAALPAEIARVNADVVTLNEVSPAALRALLASDFVREQYYTTEVMSASNLKRTHNRTLERDASSVAGNIILSRLYPSAAWTYTWSSPITAMPLDCVIVCVATGLGAPLTVCGVHTRAMHECARTRRAQLREVSAAVRELNPSASVVVMGDTNLHDLCEDGIVAECGMLDLWAETHFGSASPFNDALPGYTFDAAVNALIPRYIPPDRRRMRLDRVLMSPRSHWHPAAPAWLFGTQPVTPSSSLFLSDHFGIAVDVAWREGVYEGDPAAAAALAGNAALPPTHYTIPKVYGAWSFVRHALWLLFVVLTRPVYTWRTAWEEK